MKFVAIWLSDEFVRVFLGILDKLIETWVQKVEGYQESLQNLSEKVNLADREDDLHGLLKLNLALKFSRRQAVHEFRRLDKWVDLFQALETKEDVYFLTAYLIAEICTILSKSPGDRSSCDRFRDSVIPSYLRELRLANDIFDYYTGVYRLDEIHLSHKVEHEMDPDPDAAFLRQRRLIEEAMR